MVLRLARLARLAVPVVAVLIIPPLAQPLHQAKAMRVVLVIMPPRLRAVVVVRVLSVGLQPQQTAGLAVPVLHPRLTVHLSPVEEEAVVAVVTQAVVRPQAVLGVQAVAVLAAQMTTRLLEQQIQAVAAVASVTPRTVRAGTARQAVRAS